MSNTVETSLEWVTFSEEDTEDVCESVSGCPNQAVYRVTFMRNCCHGDMLTCVPCTARSLKLTPIGVTTHCLLCGSPNGVDSVRPIRRK